jgi:hypothetical protein
MLLQLTRRIFLCFSICIGIISCGDTSTSSNSDRSINSSEKEPAVKYINGLTTGDIYVPLEEKGFKIDKQFAGEDFFINCSLTNSSTSAELRIASKGTDKVIEVKASFTDFSADNTNRLAAEFLGFIATATYEGADPNKARKWVEDNISKNATTEISGVTFEIAANFKTIRTLTMWVK